MCLRQMILTCSPSIMRSKIWPTIVFRTKGIMNHASHNRGLSQLCLELYLVIFQGMLKTKQQFTMKPKDTMIESSDRVSRGVALFL